MSIGRDEIAVSGFALLAMTEMASVESFVKICRKSLGDIEVDVQAELKVKGSRLKVRGMEFWVHDPELRGVPVMSPKLGRRRHRRRSGRGRKDISSPPRLRRGVSGIILSTVYCLRSTIDAGTGGGECR